MSEELLKPVSLRGLTPFASGIFRDVFIHPDDDSKCIKICHQRRARTLAPSFFRRILDGNAREVLEYQRLISLNIQYEQYFPRFYGTVETDLGPGVCVELLRGSDGKLPVSMDRFCAQALDQKTGQFIRQEYKKFWEFCEQNLILSSSVEFRNVGIIQINGVPKLVSFDVKQTKSKKLIAVVDWSATLKKKRIRKRFVHHMKKLENRLQHSFTPIPT
jgi:hypothetical protein